MRPFRSVFSILLLLLGVLASAAGAQPVGRQSVITREADPQKVAQIEARNNNALAAAEEQCNRLTGFDSSRPPDLRIALGGRALANAKAQAEFDHLISADIRRRFGFVAPSSVCNGEVLASRDIEYVKTPEIISGKGSKIPPLRLTKVTVRTGTALADGQMLAITYMLGSNGSGEWWIESLDIGGIKVEEHYRPYAHYAEKYGAEPLLQWLRTAHP